MKKEILSISLASAMILLFIYTGFSKLFNMEDFADAMKLQPLPTWMTRVLAKTLPFLEMVVAAILMWPKTRLVGFYASAILMLAFSLYVGMGAVHIFKYVPCSCGGVFRHMSWPHHFWLNLFFLAISLAGIMVSRKHSHPTPSSQQVNFS
jgi:hypothetical protein